MSTISGIKLYELLEQIDNGYAPTEEEITQIKETEYLNLTGIKLETLPESIGLLSSLIELDVSYTGIKSLPPTVAYLTSLQKLYFGFSEATSLPKEIFQITSLQVLYINNTNISTIPEEIGRLSSLKMIHAINTEISSLPKSIGQLTSLEILELGDTCISEIPSEIRQIKSLRALSLNNTEITKLPEWIGDLPNLECLDLSGLKLSRIPKSLAMRGLPFVSTRNIKYGINLHGVTLTDQGNLSVFLESPNLIPDLYKDQIPLRESKVIFLGDGGVGKTYTILRLRNNGKKESPENPYLTEETHGVEIGDYHVDRGEDSFTIHFWDFGGQEILHSMHRCFLTEETCYVVMLRTRENEATSRVRYWLRAVQASAPQSPVLLFVNCWNNATGNRAIDATQLMQDFPQISKIVYCSAKEAEDDEFRQKVIIPLTEIVAESEMCRKTINRRWKKLICAIQDRQKSAIKLHEKNYLTRTEYLSLCADAEITDKNVVDLLTLLNNLGVCFSYHLDKANRIVRPDYKLLNPIWLTNALYAIIEEGSAHAQEGIINVNSIRTMLHNEAQGWLPKEKYRRTVPDFVYEDEECQYILDVAEAHMLCYRLNEETVFFPALCETDTPKEALRVSQNGRQHVSYLIRYSYLPDSVIHQLMIRCMQSGMSVKPRWHRGMVMSVWNIHTAYIRVVDETNLRIDIYSTGEQRAYALFWMLRKEIDEINRQLSLNAEECILDGNSVFLLETVVTAAQDNAFVYDHSRKFNARKLLGEFYEETVVQTLQIENGSIVIPIRKRQYHPCNKSSFALRNALYEAYNRFCPYCGQVIQNICDMEVDHILATHYQERQELQGYLKYLSSCGFDIEKPNYIENYFPTHGYCNRAKSNRVNEFSLPYWHDIAIQHTERVLRLMGKYIALSDQQT